MKPMLAGSVDFDKLDELRFPLIATPKYDGFRVLISDGTPHTRTGKRIANKRLEKMLVNSSLTDVDGEIHSPTLTFQQLMSITRSEYITDFNLDYVLFDSFTDPELRFIDREKYLKANARCSPLNYYESQLLFYTAPSVQIIDLSALMDYFCEQLSIGHEGIMLRDPNGIYKEGRSTLNESYLLKMKPEHRGIATIVYVHPLINKHGFEKPLLGSFVLQNKEWGTFSVGTGFTQKERQVNWRIRKQLIGRSIAFTYATTGNKDSPRFLFLVVFLTSKEIRMNRTQLITVVVNTKEKLLVQQEAARRDETVSSFIRGKIVAPLVKKDYERLLKKAKQREKLSTWPN